MSRSPMDDSRGGLLDPLAEQPLPPPPSDQPDGASANGQRGGGTRASLEQVRATLARVAQAVQRSRASAVRGRAHIDDSAALLRRTAPPRVTTDPSRAELRSAVEAYAHDLRRSGDRPERMLVLVKAMVTEATGDVYVAREIMDDVVRWSIEAFYTG